MEITELRVLEERVQALMARCQLLLQEKGRLEEDLKAKEEQILRLEAELDGLRQERAAVKERVARLIDLIDATPGMGDGGAGSSVGEGATVGDEGEHSLFAQSPFQEE